MTRCFQKGAEKVPYLASGEIRFVVRVTESGGVRAAWVKDSTLGDRDTETCMVDVLKGASWPKPVGGKEGIAENSFTFDADGEERAPVAWQPSQLGRALEEVKGALKKCRSEAGGKKPLSATLYVETDGKPKSIGVAAADERGASASDGCVASALEGMTFPSPGRWASKVTVTID